MALDARIEAHCEKHVKELFPTVRFMYECSEVISDLQVTRWWAQVKNAATVCTYLPLIQEETKHTSKLRTKLATTAGGAEVTTKITDEAGAPLGTDALKAGAQVTAILSLSYVWAASQTKESGLSAYVEMIRVHAGDGALEFVADPAEAPVANGHADMEFADE